MKDSQQSSRASHFVKSLENVEKLCSNFGETDALMTSLKRDTLFLPLEVTAIIYSSQSKGL